MCDDSAFDHSKGGTMIRLIILITILATLTKAELKHLAEQIPSEFIWKN
jgi:hypothetical protein